MTRLEPRRIWILGLLLALAGCDPSGLEALRKGDEALAAGRPAEAIPLLERAVTDLPSHALSWNHLGLAYQETGRPDEARKAYLRALQFDRNLFDIHFNLGALEYEAGRWIESERALRTYLGVEANRTNVTATRLLGEAQLAMNQLDAAEKTLATAVQLAPQDPSVRQSLGVTLARKKRWREAQAQFSWIVKNDPENEAATLNLAVALQQTGDRRGALEQYRSFLTHHPTSPSGPAVRSQILELESTFAPPPVVSTNLLVLKPKLPTNDVKPPAATNASAIPAPRPAAPPPVRVLTNTPSGPPVTRPATNPPPVVRPPPVEVVQVEEAPRLQVARDPQPPISLPTASGPSEIPAPSPPPVTTPTPVDEPATPAPDTTATNFESRKTFWQRINPATWGNPTKWFRGTEEPTNSPPADSFDSRTVPPTYTLAAAPTSGTSPTATSAPTNAPTQIVRRAPPKPVIVRYPRNSPPSVNPGNRTAAEAVANALSDDRVAAWQRAVQLDPSWAAGWQQMGRLALESGRPTLALPAGEAAVLLEPGSASAHQLFAAALARSGYPADAAVELEQSIQLAPGNAATHLALAGIYARDLADPSLARPHYERVLVLDPGNSQAPAIRLWLANNP